MDYKTKPTSREELRSIARCVRKLFKCNNKYRFNVMTAFEKMPTMFPTVTCTVVEDDEIEGDIPARCIPDFEGHYTIEVKKIEPSKIICFGTPFPEMGGNIIAVDYAESRKAVS